MTALDPWLFVVMTLGIYFLGGISFAVILWFLSWLIGKGGSDVTITRREKPNKQERER